MAQINKPNEYFNTVLYTGTNANQSITGVGFQPDWVWSKSRNNAQEHFVFDSVRGVYNWLATNDTKAETNTTTSLTSFDSDGFTLGTSSVANANTYTYASWNWLAGGTGVSNTQGSIASTVSANTTSGFSIGTYSGNGTSDATIGHGLSSIPEMIIVKRRFGLDNWQVYWNTGTERNGFLNLTNAFNTPAATAQWGTNEPTSSVFYVGNDNSNNASSNDYVFYAFHSVKGYSKFGEYTGNGSADGTFIYTGFKPAFVITKRTDVGIGWTLIDNKRDPYNVTDKRLFPNESGVEVVSANGNTDFLSNGIKIRTGHLGINESGGPYIYMAFAENPLVGTNNIPTTAR